MLMTRFVLRRSASCKCERHPTPNRRSPTSADLGGFAETEAGGRRVARSRL